MAIYILRPPEPLSEPAVDSQRHTAKSSASRLLSQEMRRYCRREIQGRSFLVAGHRGSGKTTMVADVLASMLEESLASPDALRPLPVMLHGPSLFKALPSDLAAAPPPAPAAVWPPGLSPAQSEPKALDPDEAFEKQAEMALKQIILGLHRAVLREYARAYRSVVVPVDDGPFSHEVAEYGELAAQFELELMEDPPASRLREFWARINALGPGILFPQRRRQDQGARELVALNGICNAHQRISGELSGLTDDKSNQSRDAQRQLGLEAQKADAWKPLVSVLSGAAVAGGAAASHVTALPYALLAGLGSVFVSAIVMKSSVTYVQKRERNVDKKFIPDLSVRTLDRILPTLLERLRDAGLAPVFVIDELDKVEGLSEQIRAMVRFLKKLVAESVFTCFLTDRGYMEYLRLESQEKAYGVASSYFSHPLPVIHEPGDLEQYLKEVIGARGGEAELKADKADMDVLKWVLRHRSQMHALSLTRVLASITAPDGRCNIRPGDVRTRMVYRIDVTLQVAIEYLLSSAEVVGWSLQHPSLRMTLFDALYFITRAWLRGVERIDLRTERKHELRLALFDRMNLPEVCGIDDDRFGPKGRFDTARKLITQDDLQILFGKVQELARMLADEWPRDTNLRAEATDHWPVNPDQRLDAPAVPRPPEVVLESLLFGDDSFLIPIHGAPMQFRFRYWPSGQPRDARAARLELEAVLDQAGAAVRFVDVVRDALGELLFNGSEGERAAGSDFALLTDDAKVLPQTPPWQAAMVARDQLAAAVEAGDGAASVLADQLKVLQDFERRLRESLAAVGPVVLMAGWLAGVAGHPLGRDELRTMIGHLSRGLAFQRLDSNGVIRQVARLHNRFAADFDADIADAAVFRVDGSLDPRATDLLLRSNLSGQRLGQALEARTASRTSASPQASWAGVCDKAWSAALRRTMLDRRAEPVGEASPEEILCRVRELGPGRYLAIDIGSTSLSAWSRLWLDAVARRQDRVDETPPPRGLVREALDRCGLDNLEEAEIRQLAGAMDVPDHVDRLGGLKHASPLLLSSANAQEPGWPGVLLILRRAGRSATDSWTRAPTRGFLVITSEAQLRDEALSILLQATSGPKTLFREPAAYAASASGADEPSRADLGYLRQLGVEPHDSMEGPAAAKFWALPDLEGPDGANEFLLAAARHTA